MSLAPERLSVAGAVLAYTVGVSLVLLLWMLVRWRTPHEWFGPHSELPAGWHECWTKTGAHSAGAVRFRLRLLDEAMSPAVCGLFHPVILVRRLWNDSRPPSSGVCLCTS